MVVSVKVHVGIIACDVEGKEMIKVGDKYRNHYKIHGSPFVNYLGDLSKKFHKYTCWV